MAKVFSLENFRRDRKLKDAVVSDDGNDATLPAKSSTVPFSAAVKPAAAPKLVPDGPSVVWRSLVNETICRLGWDYQEYRSRAIGHGVDISLFDERRAALERDSDEIYGFFPKPAPGSRDCSVTLPAAQYRKIEQFEINLSRLISDVAGAVKCAQQHA